MGLFSLHTSGQTLSPQAKVSLLTVAPGEELYSVFGHSAIRVHDSINQIDWVYNYGMFDFNTPNFYLKFANGNLDYLLMAGRFKYFLSSYIGEKRSVTELQLNLTADEVQKLFDSLNENAKPENRSYRYDFFFDNCATRIRDKVFENIGGGQAFDKNETGEALTFRQLYGSYLQHSPWIEFGIHLLLGMKADRTANAWDEMYLPDYLHGQFKTVTMSVNNQTPRRLVGSETKLLEFERPSQSKNVLFGPSSIWGAFLVFVLSFSILSFRRRFSLRIFDFAFFLSVGLIGLLFTFLCFFTKHSVTSYNFNLLWGNPLVLLFALLLLFNKKTASFQRILSLFLLGFNVIFVIVAVVGIQRFPAGLHLLVGSLSIRYLMIYLASNRIVLALKRE